MVGTQIGNAGFFQSNYVAGLVLQADGKIVLGGTANGQFALVRYNADGSLDATYGNAGTVVTPLVGMEDFAKGIALQSDGKILVAGRFVEGIDSSNFGTVRYNTDGTLDATFGQGGIVDTPFAGQNSEATQVAVQANGDVVVAGDADANGSTYHAAIVRYTPNGKLDATFGNGGQVLTNIQTDTLAVQLVLQADGKILLGTSAGSAAPIENEEVLARYNGDGSIDASFGDGGQTVTNLGQYSVNLTDMALEPDGKIVTAGFSYSASLENPDEIGKLGPFLTLARFQNDSLPLILLTPPVATLTPPVTIPTDGPSATTDAPETSAPPAVVVPSTPPQVVPNNLVFTQGPLSQGPSVVIPQSSAVPVAPSRVAMSAVGSGSSAADPFGIHLVGGSGPDNLDATTRWDGFPVLAPDYLMGDSTTGLAALPFTPVDEAGDSMTVVMDALFQQMPLWTMAETAPVGAIEPSAAPLADFPAKKTPHHVASREKRCRRRPLAESRRWRSAFHGDDGRDRRRTSAAEACSR